MPDTGAPQPIPCLPEIAAERITTCLDCGHYSLGNCQLAGCCDKSLTLKVGWALSQCPANPPKWLRINFMKTLIILTALMLALTSKAQYVLTNIDTTITTNYSQLATALNLNYGTTVGWLNSLGATNQFLWNRLLIDETNFDAGIIDGITNINFSISNTPIGSSFTFTNTGNASNVAQILIGIPNSSERFGEVAVSSLATTTAITFTTPYPPGMTNYFICFGASGFATDPNAQWSNKTTNGFTAMTAAVSGGGLLDYFTKQ